MQRYMISFDDGAMDHIAQEDLPSVSVASRAVVSAAKDDGVWVFGGGFFRQQRSVVAVDGSATEGPVPEDKAVLGGFALVEVASRERALEWAARFASACRCPQDVREVMYDPES